MLTTLKYERSGVFFVAIVIDVVHPTCVAYTGCLVTKHTPQKYFEAFHSFKCEQLCYTIYSLHPTIQYKYDTRRCQRIQGTSHSCMHMVSNLDVQPMSLHDVFNVRKMELLMCMFKHNFALHKAEWHVARMTFNLPPSICSSFLLIVCMLIAHVVLFMLSRSWAVGFNSGNLPFPVQNPPNPKLPCRAALRESSLVKGGCAQSDLAAHMSSVIYSA